jgi:hypothetical protein
MTAHNEPNKTKLPGAHDPEAEEEGEERLRGGDEHADDDERPQPDRAHDADALEEGERRLRGGHADNAQPTG